MARATGRALPLAWPAVQTVLDQHPSYQAVGVTKYIAAYVAQNGQQLALNRDPDYPDREAKLFIECDPGDRFAVHLEHYPAHRTRSSNLSASDRVPRLDVGHDAWLVSAFTERSLPALLDWYGSQATGGNALMAAEQDLQRAEIQVELDAGFEPDSLEDARERVRRQLVLRRGQSKFRRDLLEAYDGCCAISGCAVPSVLEAAHIVPYLGETTNVVGNGLLLRADLHTLFDLDLLAIHPETQVILVETSARQDPSYAIFHGTKLRGAAVSEASPLGQYLRHRYDQAKWADDANRALIASEGDPRPFGRRDSTTKVIADGGDQGSAAAR